MDETTEKLGAFFDYIWGPVSPNGGPCYVYLPVFNATWDKQWVKFMFAWPRQKQAVIRHVLKHNAQECDVYFSPALFSAATPIKENVMGSRFLWVDFDGNAPESWEGLVVPEPTLIIQSSIPGHEHCYWRLDEFLFDREVLEERNASLAYHLEADTSGWDADQVLRPPYTMNYKRYEPVEIVKWV